MREAPTENLVRAWAGADALSLRDTGDGGDGGDGNTLVGYLSRFNEWTEIRSSYEGHFLERVMPGAFDRTVAARGQAIRCLYDHGKDPSIGNKPLGTFAVLEARDGGQWYEVPLFDAGYVNDLKPAIRAGALGSSFRFSVSESGEAWDRPLQPTAWNPDKLPERSILDTDLYEGGPVTFPAYAGASAGLRSATDDFVAALVADPTCAARFAERADRYVLDKLLASTRSDLTFAQITENVETAIETLLAVDDMTSDVWICDITDTWVVYQVWGTAVDDSEYFKITYTIDTAGAVTLTSDPQPVEQQYVPTTDTADGRAAKLARLTRKAPDGPTLEQRQRWLTARSLLTLERGTQ